MTRKRQDLFERVEVELYPLGGEISKRISADAKRAGLTADRMVQAVLERKASLDKHTLPAPRRLLLRWSLRWLQQGVNFRPTLSFTPA